MTKIPKIPTPLILDGAMGTQLHKKGLPQSACPEQWILQHPEAVSQIQNSYIEAGSQVIYAPTFGANRSVLERHGIFDCVEEYNKKLVSLSREIAHGRAKVAGDISSTGGMLYPMGSLRFEEMYDIYLEQARALEEAGVDLFVIETMTSMAEARAAVLAVKQVSEKPVFVTFSCDDSGRTMMGTDVCAALLVLQGMGIDAFGLNCSTGPEEMAKQIRRLHTCARVPLIAKANAGLPEEVNGSTVFNVGADAYAALVPDLIDAGATIIGGCCGTDADYIRGIKTAVETAIQEGGLYKSMPESGDYLPCATEKDIFLLPAGANCRAVLSCDDDLEDAIYELEGDEPFCIQICSPEDVETFADVQYCIRNPLFISCDSVDLLEKALRAYQGRAMYAGSLSDSALAPLVLRYGLIAQPS